MKININALRRAPGVAVAGSFIVVAVASVAASWTAAAQTQSKVHAHGPVVCIEVEPGNTTSPAEARSALERAVPATNAAAECLMGDIEAVEIGYAVARRADVEGPTFRIGCKDGFRALPDHLPRQKGTPALPYRLAVDPGTRSQPADEQVHIFVTSAPRVVSASVVKVPYEINCEGHVCQEVSTAAYLDAAVLDDEAATAEALLDALGMRIPANSPADAVSPK